MKRIMPFIMPLLLLGIMVFTSELLGEREIIFPEITAIAIGALLAPKQSWNGSPFRILSSIAVMSVAGVLLVRYVPIPYYFKIPLGFALSICCLVISKTGFVPMISACVLPVILKTESFIYPISAIAMTAAILFVQQIFFKAKIREKRPFIKQPFNKSQLLFWIKHLAFISILAIIPVLSEQMFFIVPPLIVAYVEMSFEGSKLRECPLNAVVMIAFSACIGVLSRIFLCEYIGIPLTLTAVIAVCILLVIMTRTKLYMPPAGAIATLPMLLKAENLWLYPIEVTVGFTIMTIIAVMLFNKRSCP